MRYTPWLAAVLFHIGLLWLILSSTINRTEPLPADSVEVAIVPPSPPPKAAVQPSKPVPAKPAVKPAEIASSAARPQFRPLPRLAHMAQPPIQLSAPPSSLAETPVIRAASGPAEAGAPAGGSGSNGAGSGKGGQEGNDYLIRLKAYIDEHRGRTRHREPNDVEVSLTLDQDGVLKDIQIIASSGEPPVDEEIMNQLKAMSPFPKPPAVLFSASKPLLRVVDKWIFPRP